MPRTWPMAAGARALPFSRERETRALLAGDEAALDADAARLLAALRASEAHLIWCVRAASPRDAAGLACALA